MSLEFYRVMHFVGMFMLFLGLGGAVVRSIAKVEMKNLERLALLNHGLGLLLIIVAGFGQLAKLGLSFGGAGGWLHVKVVLALVMGVMVVFIKKMPSKGVVLWYAALVMGVVAAYLAVMKPF